MEMRIIATIKSHNRTRLHRHPYARRYRQANETKIPAQNDIYRNRYTRHNRRDNHRTKCILCRIKRPNAHHLNRPKYDRYRQYPQYRCRLQRIFDAKRPAFIDERCHGLCQDDEKTDQDERQQDDILERLVQRIGGDVECPLGRQLR